MDKLNKNMTAIAQCITLCLVMAVSWSVVQASTSEKFIGKLVLEDIGDGRHFRLSEQFGYVDRTGRNWVAEEGYITDGASIPRVFWTFVGGPFSGEYRKAAVIHDYYCDNKYRPWEDVHKVFYDAMITAGTSTLKSKLMYYAVWRFGPRWRASAIVPCIPAPQLGKFCASSKPYAIEIESQLPELDEDSMEKAQEELEGVRDRIKNLSLDQIEDLADQMPSPPLRRYQAVLSAEDASLYEGLHLIERPKD